MPAIRRHPITGDPILFAPERAGRINAFRREESGDCPFCPGNEGQTPPPITTIGDPWRLRVFPNKYPSIEGHEVIVETARHDDELDSIGHAEDVVNTYSSRYSAHRDAARYVAIFKNSGQRGGASIHHAHSQVMPLPFVPPRVEREIAGFGRSETCPLCIPPPDALVIAEYDSLLRYAPSGSTFAYQQWIVARRHVASIDLLTDKELTDLAPALQQSVKGTRRVADAFNVLLMNFPAGTGGHFYVDIFPRLTGVAGFELATGTFIDIIDPAAAARAVR